MDNVISKLKIAGEQIPTVNLTEQEKKLLEALADSIKALLDFAASRSNPGPRD